jgi:hypothetical protein
MTNTAQQLNENDKIVDFKIQLDATGSIYPVLKKAVEEVYFVLVLDGVCDELSESDLDSFCDNIEIVQLNETTFSFELAEETYTVNLLI